MATAKLIMSIAYMQATGRLTPTCHQLSGHTVHILRTQVFTTAALTDMSSRTNVLQLMASMSTDTRSHKKSTDRQKRLMALEPSATSSVMYLDSPTTIIHRPTTASCHRPINSGSGTLWQAAATTTTKTLHRHSTPSNAIHLAGWT